MKAVSILEAGHVGIVDLPEPSMRPDEVLIEVKYIGLCGSDLNTYRGTSPMVTYPRVPGHEIAGMNTSVFHTITHWDIIASTTSSRKII